MATPAVATTSLIGGADVTNNGYFGDAYAMLGNARGGSDTLVGGNGTGSQMRGDAVAMNDQAIGGADRLISGTGSDHMWGDAQYINEVEVLSPATDTGLVQTGADTFVFGPGNGEDFVYDFRQSDGDRIDVSAYGFDDLGDLAISATNGNTLIAFDADNSVMLVGFVDPSALRAADFLFA